MSPLRIIIIAILLYIAYRLIFGNKKVTSKKQKIDKSNTEQHAVNDVLVEDPVCHNLVPKQQAVTIELEGELKYFCSQECCDKFVGTKGENQ